LYCFDFFLRSLKVATCVLQTCCWTEGCCCSWLKQETDAEFQPQQRWQAYIYECNECYILVWIRRW